jgi:hypothetical protein
MNCAWKIATIISYQNNLHYIQCTPRQVSSRTATSVQRCRGSCGYSDRHAQCDGQVTLCCQQELHAQGVPGVFTGKNPEDSNVAGVEAIQWVLLYLSMAYDRRSWEQLASHGWNMPEHHCACASLVHSLPVVQLPVALADHVRGSLSCGCLQADVLILVCVGVPKNHQKSLPTY